MAAQPVLSLACLFVPAMLGFSSPSLNLKFTTTNESHLQSALQNVPWCMDSAEIGKQNWSCTFNYTECRNDSDGRNSSATTDCHLSFIASCKESKRNDTFNAIEALRLQYNDTFKLCVWTTTYNKVCLYNMMEDLRSMQRGPVLQCGNMTMDLLQLHTYEMQKEINYTCTTKNLSMMCSEVHPAGDPSTSPTITGPPPTPTITDTPSPTTIGPSTSSTITDTPSPTTIGPPPTPTITDTPSPTTIGPSTSSTITDTPSPTTIDPSTSSNITDPPATPTTIAAVTISALVLLGILASVIAVLVRRKCKTFISDKCLKPVYVGEEPVYENPDAMVSSPAVMTTAELPSQGPDAEVHHITIVPPWSYRTLGGQFPPMEEGECTLEKGGEATFIKGHYEVDDAATEEFWEPPDEVEDLYNHLWQRKYREIPRKSIILQGDLGEGQFGKITKGIWLGPGQIEVAIKILKDEPEKAKLLKEAAIMGQFAHPNIVQLYGLTTITEPTMMIMELLSNGDLRSYLISKKDNNEAQVALQTVCPVEFLKFCRQIVAGMVYLSQKGFVHRDLAARNILLDSAINCKIADFGMSRNIAEDCYYITSGGRIPIKWTAPEALLQRKYSASSDVWSYGIVMFEMWSFGCKPFDDKTAVEVIAAFQQKTDYIQPSPPGCPLEMYRIMVMCWSFDHHSRPSFEAIEELLKKDDSDLLTVASTTATSDETCSA